jgi:hypothetical protein
VNVSLIFLERITLRNPTEDMIFKVHAIFVSINDKIASQCVSMIEYDGGV